MSILLDLLFPRTCVGCGQTGRYLCSHCQATLVYKSIKPDNRLSLFRYHGTIKQIITDLKFNFVTDIVPEITILISHSLVNRYPHLLRYWQENNYTLVPIPLHQSRQNWRGFNQSQLICQKLSTELNLNYGPNLLVRTRNTISQTSIKDKHLRRTNTAQSFQMINDKWLNDKYILFDDVYTTGSTIKSATSVFPKNTNVWTLTLAG